MSLSVETATTSTPSAAASSASAARIVDSRSPRFEPSPTYARGTAASLATLARVVGRRLFAVCALALCLCGAASAVVARTTTDPLEPQEWWLAKIGATPAAAPPAGVPITIVDSGTAAAHPEFAGRPATTYLNAQTTTGSHEYHGTLVASIAAAPENGVGIVGVYPTAASGSTTQPDDRTTSPQAP